MNPTFFFGDDPEEKGVPSLPPLPINFTDSGDDDFKNFANSTQRSNQLLNSQKKSQRLLPQPEEIDDLLPNSQRKYNINPILIKSPRIRENPNRVILENGDSYIGPSDSSRSTNRSTQDSYMGPSDSYIGPSDSSSGRIGWVDAYAESKAKNSTKSVKSSYYSPNDSYMGPSESVKSSMQNPNSYFETTQSFTPKKQDYQNFEQINPEETSFKPVQIDGNLPELPTPAATPTRLVQTVRVRALRQEIEQASKMWLKRISEEEKSQKEHMQQLIASHVQEIRIFDERNGTMPRAVSALPPTIKMICSGGNRPPAGFVRVPIATQRNASRKPVATPRGQVEESTKRKMIIARQQKEIIAANNECNQKLSAIRYQMERDIERRCIELSNVAGYHIDYKELIYKDSEPKNIPDKGTYQLVIKQKI